MSEGVYLPEGEGTVRLSFSSSIFLTYGVTTSRVSIAKFSSTQPILSEMMHLNLLEYDQYLYTAVNEEDEVPEPRCGKPFHEFRSKGYAKERRNGDPPMFIGM